MRENEVGRDTLRVWPMWSNVCAYTRVCVKKTLGANVRKSPHTLVNKATQDESKMKPAEIPPAGPASL